MADTSNLSKFLSDVADAIRTKKETIDTIPAKDFDTEILSIETGIDTSDATATANNIENGYTAYVNGKKISGTITTSLDTIITAGSDATITDTGEALTVDRGYGEKIILKSEQQLRSTIPYATIASMGGVTSDKIIKGETVFGVEGTAEPGGTDAPVKLFETVEEMQAYTGAEEGNIAVVMSDIPLTNEVGIGSTIRNLYFPDTIVLENAITETLEDIKLFWGDEIDYNGYYRVSPTKIIFQMNSVIIDVSNQKKCNATYTSTDGITYTISSSTGRNNGVMQFLFARKLRTTSNNDLFNSLSPLLKREATPNFGVYKYTGSAWTLYNAGLSGAASDVSKNISIYGKNGVENGTVGLNDPETNLTDTSYMIWNDLQKLYKAKNLTFSGTELENYYKLNFLINEFPDMKFNTEACTSFYRTFYWTRSMTYADLSSWTSTNVTNMSGMFQKCESLKYLDISGMTFDNVTSYSDMFTTCTSLEVVLVKDQSAKAFIDARLAAAGVSITSTIKEYGVEIKLFDTVEEMNAYSAKENDLALVYNTSSEGVYKYTTFENQIVIPSMASIKKSGETVSYTPSDDDVYLPYDKICNAVNSLLNAYSMKSPSIFGTNGTALKYLSVTIINNKPYAVVAKGTKSSKDFYRTVSNTFDSEGNITQNIYGLYTNMTNDKTIMLFEIDTNDDSGTYKEPIYLTPDFAVSNYYKYQWNDQYVCNHVNILVNNDGTITTNKTYFIDGTSTTVSANIVLEPASITKWMLQPNTKYLDTSDATATANDLNKGTTAYVNGNKITGVSGLFNIDTDVKRYDTFEELDAVYDEPLGTKGMIYGGINEFPISKGHEVKSITIPEIIVFPEAITSTSSISVGARHSNGGTSGNLVSISPTSGYVGFSISSSRINVPYTTEDGITYTRGEITNTIPSVKIENNVIIFPDNISITCTNVTNPDIVGYAFKQKIKTLGGIYEMSEYDDYTINQKCSTFNDIINNNASRTLLKCYVGREYTWSYASIITGHKGKYRNIEDCVIMDELYMCTSYSGVYLLHDTSKSKWLYGYRTTFSNTVNKDEEKTVKYRKIINGNLTDHEIKYTINSLEYVSTLSSGSIAVFVPIYEITDIDNTYLLQNSNYNTYIYDTTLDNSTQVNYKSGNSYVTVIKYIPMETQMSLNNNNQLLPGNIAIGKDGKTFVGDDSVYDALSTDQIISKIYDEKLYGTSTNVYEGYDFNHFATYMNKNKLNYAKLSSDVSILQDGAIGKINSCKHIKNSSIKNELTKYGSYTSLVLVDCSIEYNMIITIQYTTLPTACIVIYDWDTREVVYTSPEFTYYGTNHQYSLNGDYVIIASFSDNTGINITKLNLTDFTLSTVVNLTGTYYYTTSYWFKIINDYVVYITSYKDSSTSKYDNAMYIWNYTDGSSPIKIKTESAASSPDYHFGLADNTNYLYIGSYKYGLIKINKSDSSIVYTSSVKTPFQYMDNICPDQPDNLGWVFLSYYMLPDNGDTAPTESYRCAIKLLDKDSNIVATSESDSYTSGYIPGEKDGKYYAMIDGVLGIGSTAEVIDSPKGTSYKILCIHCDEFYIMPTLLYTDYKNIVCYETIYSKHQLLPKSLVFNEDNSITYIVNDNYRQLNATIKQYIKASASNCDYIIVPSTSYTAKYSSANMILQKISDTSTGPISQEEYDIAVATSEDILGNTTV